MSDAVFPAPDGTRYVLTEARRYDPQRCPHTNVEIDTALAKLHCKMCGAEVCPVAWLDNLRRERVLWDYARVELEKQRMRLEAKRSTRCEHCNKVTRVTEPRDGLHKYKPDAAPSVAPSERPRLLDDAPNGGADNPS